MLRKVKSICKNRRLQSLLILSCFLVLSICYVIPLWKQGVVFSGDDLPYHVERLNELFENFKRGNLFPGFATYYFKKIGYPVNIFYPWITLIPFVCIRFIVKNPVSSIYLGISFYTFLTMLFTYHLTMRISKHRLQSFVTSILYAFCAYRTIDAFARFALGEFIALTFIPLVFYGLYSVLFADYKDWYYLGIGLSFVALSHVLSTFIYSLTLLFIFLCSFYFIDQKKQRLISLIKSVVLFFLSSAIFIFPFLEQISFQTFSQPSIYRLSNYSLQLSELVLQSLNNNLDTAITSGGSTYNIGIVLLIVVFIGFFQYKVWNSIYRFTFILGISLAIFSTNLIPWISLQHTMLSLIQFPWRFLGLSSFMLSIIGGKEFYDIYRSLSIQKRLMDRSLFAIILVLLITVPWFSGIQHFKHQVESQKYIYRSFNNKLNGLLYLDQYTPTVSKTQIDRVAKHKTNVDGKNFIITHIQSRPNELILRSLKFRNAKRIVLPIVYYRNISIYQGHHRIKSINKNSTDLIVLKDITSSTICIKYRTTLIFKLSCVISLCTWIFCISKFLIKYTKLLSH